LLTEPLDFVLGIDEQTRRNHDDTVFRVAVGAMQPFYDVSCHGAILAACPQKEQVSLIGQKPGMDRSERVW
jgi:hypothetical protein